MIKQYNAKQIELASLEFWEKNSTYNQVKKKNIGRKPFYFLQGPPYTSGNIHIGHAWNGALKDMLLRYKRMNGFAVWDRWGYDMHGLPTENKVQKELGLKTKDDIVAFGVDKFVMECSNFAKKTASIMNDDFRKLGMWMDFEHAYMPITNEFISGEWMLIKKAFESKRLYKGKKSMTWDKATETAHAKHELEYKTITDTAIYVKFRIKDTNEFLIIWTTTPWTIPFNMLVMVNPIKTYVKASVGDEVWIVAKDLLEEVMSKADKQYNVIEEFAGSKLEGRRYEHFFSCPFPFAEKLHSVVMSEKFVDTSSGTGLVHCAPGCGAEDFEVGMENGVFPFNLVNERGIFENMGEFDGLVARDDDKIFIEKISEKGALVAKEKVQHEYPHSWRSHEPVIFRATDQWFMKTEDLREQLLKQNKDVTWNPEFIKDSFERWVGNVRDNAITRQRFWGCPVPIWEDEDGNVEVIGSLDELKEKAITQIPEDLHKPFIDGVKLKGPTGKEMSRVPDVLDVWLDSGTVSWNSLDFQNNKDVFEQLFPADAIIEGADQARLWFTMLQICSAIMFGKTAYKNVYSHGMIMDWHGEKMSKSLGNVISPKEVLDKYGADVFRYYVCGSPAGKNMNFTWEEITLKQRNVNVLWNVKNFFLDLESQVKDVAPCPNGIEEKYILSLVHSTIKDVTNHFEKYELDFVVGKVEKLFLELSRTYIQMVRDKASLGSDEEKRCVYDTLKESLKAITILLSPIIPLTAEQMYQECKFSSEESVHLLDWPAFDEESCDKELEEDMQIAMDVLQAGLAAREQASIGLRWPVKEVLVQSKDGKTCLAVDRLQSILKNQLNAKSVKSVESIKGITYTMKANFASLGKKVGANLPKVVEVLNGMSPLEVHSGIKGGNFSIDVNGEKVILEERDIVFTKQVPEQYASSDISSGVVLVDKTRDSSLEVEGFSRELMRRVQQLRKEAGLNKVDRIKLHIKTDFIDLDLYSEHIAEKCGANSATISTNSSEFQDRGIVEIKGKKFVVYFDVVRS